VARAAVSCLSFFADRKLTKLAPACQALGQGEFQIPESPCKPICRQNRTMVGSRRHFTRQGRHGRVHDQRSLCEDIASATLSFRLAEQGRAAAIWLEQIHVGFMLV